MPQHRRKKRVMRHFKIDEVSAVDFPAQEGARMVIMKRDAENDDVVEKRVFLTQDHEDGHAHLIFEDDRNGGFTSFSGATEEHGHHHPWVRMEDGSIMIGAAAGHSHALVDGVAKVLLPGDQVESLSSSDETIAKASGFWGDKSSSLWHIMKRAEELGIEIPVEGDLASLVALVEKAGPSKEIGNMSDKEIKKTAEDLAKELEEAQTKTAEVETALKVAKRLADMTDEQKEFYNDMEPEAATKFLEKSAKDMDAEIAKSKEKDTVVYKAADGTEYRKSDDQRLVNMAKARDEDAKKLEEMRKANADAGYAKRADTELEHLPGTTEVKVSLLKAVDKIADEKEREEALATLKASNADMAKAFETHGTGSDPVSKSADEEITKRAKEIAKEEKISYEAAEAKFLSTPEGSRLYSQVDKH